MTTVAIEKVCQTQQTLMQMLLLQLNNDSLEGDADDKDCCW